MKKLISFSLFMVLCAAQLLGEGFLIGTLVRTAYGFTQIQKLRTGDKVLCYDSRHNKVLEEEIEQVQRRIALKTIRVVIGDYVLQMAPDQIIYVPGKKQWISADALLKDPKTLEHFKNHFAVSCVEEVEETAEIYTLSISKCNNFFVTKKCILAHNVAILMAAPAAVTVFEAASAVASGAITMFVASKLVKAIRGNASRSYEVLPERKNPPEPEDPPGPVRPPRPKSSTEESFFKAIDDFVHTAKGMKQMHELLNNPRFREFKEKWDRQQKNDDEKPEDEVEDEPDDTPPDSDTDSSDNSSQDNNNLDCSDIEVSDTKDIGPCVGDLNPDQKPDGIVPECLSERPEQDVGCEGVKKLTEENNDIPGCGTGKFIKTLEPDEGWQCSHSKGSQASFEEEALSEETDTLPSQEPIHSDDASGSVQPHQEKQILDGAEVNNQSQTPEATESSDQQPPNVGVPAEKVSQETDGQLSESEGVQQYIPATQATLTEAEKAECIASAFDQAIREITDGHEYLRRFEENPSIPDSAKKKSLEILKNRQHELEEFWLAKLVDLEVQPTKPEQAEDESEPANLDHTIDTDYAKQQAREIKKTVDGVFAHVKKAVELGIEGEYYDLGNGMKYRDIVPPERRALTSENERWAEEQYEQIRAMKDDIKKIAENTGLPEAVIEQIKNHVFFEEHHKTLEFGRFDADSDIISAWDRLCQGDFIENDISFLKHEFAESILMRESNIYAPFHKALNENGLKWDPPRNEG